MEESFFGDQGGRGLEELPPEELETQLEGGMFQKVDNHSEHLALHPFWLLKPQQGIIEEVRKMLGKWNSR